MSKPKGIQETIQLGDGRSISIETGVLAKQADGAVMLKTGNTMLLATVVSAKEAKEDVDFMPLSVDYKEKYAALGKFPGGFLKREARPSDYEILVSRLVDRALRPLFPDDYHAETFVNVTLMSAEADTPPDALAGLAASAALAVSDIPFHGPIAECRVGRIDGELVVNPTFSELERADIELIVGATYDNILMVEGEMKEVSEAEMLEAIKFAHEAIKPMCEAQMALSRASGKEEKREYCHEVNDEELKKRIWDETYDAVYKVASSCNTDKHARSEAFAQIKEDFLAKLTGELGENDEPNETLVGKYYHDVEKEAVRRLILDEAVRLDGRKTDEIRPIWSEVDYLPSAHGSALFTRGETQSITSVTLGTKMDAKLIDDVLKKGNDTFLLHYNFPPFSTGDARPSRGTSRREVGHGNLAHRALKGILPPADEMPYTLRIVSDILESNGSSSMATVCAGTLAMMDAGIQIKKPVSGIAMGLITDKDSDKYAVLSDILGDEDHLGDMDFKVTGTADGITATQMDIKVEGLSYEVLEQALEQAKKGRLHILGKMSETIAAPNPDYKPHTPRIERIEIPKDMIGAVIGPGGKVIQEIQAETNSTITIEEIDNVGLVDVFAVDKSSIDAAMDWINGIVAVPEAGKVYRGKVKTIAPYGAFVEILPGKDGLLHISEIEWRRLEKVEDVLKEGDEVEVKLLAIDEKSGKLKLSRKALLPKPEKKNN
ncbi:MAG: polyribonucleotide nucleotidyltransferase [Bacteroidetes bacterium]|nr:MAG: polyribonucleotide nucleotidyltransferase [Bacteroidota bacterium]